MKILFNQNIFNIIIGIILLYLLRRNITKEKLTDAEKTELRSLVKEVYQVDVQAIKNLGDLSKQIMTTNGQLVLPYNVKIEGALETSGNITCSNNIYSVKTFVSDSLEVKDGGKTYVKLEKNGWGSGKGTIWVGDSGTPKVVMSAESGRIPSEYLKINDAGITIKGGTNITNAGINTGSISASSIIAENITSSGNIVATGTGTFGNAKIGNRPSNSNQVCFGHKDRFETNYFLMDNNGNNYIKGNNNTAVNLEGTLDIKKNRNKIAIRIKHNENNWGVFYLKQNGSKSELYSGDSHVDGASHNYNMHRSSVMHSISKAYNDFS